MSAEAAIISLLRNSGLAGGRVYPQSLPQDGARAKYPALIVTRISGAPLYADDGEVGLSEPRIQVDCYGNTYTEAKDLADAVRPLLSAFDGNVNGTVIQFVTLEDERDDREGGANAAEYPFRVIQDYLVWIAT